MKSSVVVAVALLACLNLLALADQDIGYVVGLDKKVYEIDFNNLEVSRVSGVIDD
jgi:hypothetical protein